MRFLTFRLDFNGFHFNLNAQGGGVGLTSTPPAHLKSRFFADEPAASNDVGDRMVPTRSDSPTFGPTAWTVPDISGPSAGTTKKPVAVLAGARAPR